MNSLLIRIRAEGPARSLIDLCLRGIVVVIGSGTKGESPGVGGIKEAIEASEISGSKDSVRGAFRSLGFLGAIGDSRELKIVSAMA